MQFSYVLLLVADMTKKKYLLKCIWHCQSIEALYETFPDACIIYMYRPIETVVPSACSMTMKTTLRWGEHDSEYGHRIVHELKQYTDKVTGFLKQFDGDNQRKCPVYIQQYQELVDDPIGSVRKIYRHFNMELAKTSEEKMQLYLCANPRHKHGAHKYSWDDYNLDRESTQQEFEQYTKYMTQKIAA